MRQTFKNEGCGVGVARLIASSDRHCFETFQVVLEIFDIPPEVKIVDKMAHCRGSSVGGLKCEGVKLGDVVSWWRSLFLFSHRFMLVWTCWSCFGVWERSGSEGACDICFFLLSKTLWFSTVVLNLLHISYLLLSNKDTRFTPNTLNGARLLKIRN